MVAGVKSRQFVIDLRNNMPKKVISVLNYTLTQETHLFQGHAYLEVESAIWLMSIKGERSVSARSQVPIHNCFRLSMALN